MGHSATERDLPSNINGPHLECALLESTLERQEPQGWVIHTLKEDNEKSEGGQCAACGLSQQPGGST